MCNDKLDDLPSGTYLCSERSSSTSRVMTYKLALAQYASLVTKIDDLQSGTCICSEHIVSVTKLMNGITLQGGSRIVPSL